MNLLNLPLIPPSPHSCLPPVFIDARGAVPDPWATLDLPTGTLDPEGVRAAFLTAVQARPPEADPRGAQRLREARDRLIEPERLLDRELGVLHLPDPAAHALPPPVANAAGPLPPEARLIGQLALYTLVEEALWTEGLGALFQEVITAARR